MGVHFTVIVEHDIRDTSLDAVRARFGPLTPLFDELSDKSQQESDKWKDFSQPGSPRPDLFFTPGGFSLHIGPAVLQMHHFTWFSTFLTREEYREPLRRFSRQLARLFGHHRALYVPCEGIGDKVVDWMTDGLSFSEIEARLRRLSNPPATIEELAARSMELRYYIEEFNP